MISSHGTILRQFKVGVWNRRKPSGCNVKTTFWTIHCLDRGTWTTPVLFEERSQCPYNNTNITPMTRQQMFHIHVMVQDQSLGLTTLGTTDQKDCRISGNSISRHTAVCISVLQAVFKSQILLFVVQYYFRQRYSRNKTSVLTTLMKAQITPHI